MRSVFALVLVIGVGLAGFAVYMAKGYIGNYEAALTQERAARAQMVPTVEVLVAKDTLRYGDQVTAESVRAVRWPQDAIPAGTYKSLEELFPEGQPAMRTVLRAMEKDEALLAVKLTEPGQDAGVVSRLTSGMRAFAIQVDSTSGVSGFLEPGHRVDVYWTGRAGGERSGGTDVTKLIQSNIKIIAIDQRADMDTAGPTIAKNVTVEASPEQVAALAQAQATGRLSLSLVGMGDDTISSPVEIDQNQLLGIVEEEIVAPDVVAPPQVCTVRTRKGGEIIETPVPCPE